MSATLTGGIDPHHRRNSMPRRASRWLTGACRVQLADLHPFQPCAATAKPAWMATVESRVAELAALEPNWDGRGSAEPSKDALWYATTLLSELMRPGIRAPSIIPLGSGAVQLVWSNQHAELEVEITRPNEISVLYADLDTGDEDEWPEDESLSRLSGLVQSMRA